MAAKIVFRQPDARHAAAFVVPKAYAWLSPVDSPFAEYAMRITRDPVLKPVEISALRPTQMTIGMREVEKRRKHLRDHWVKGKTKFFERHMIPVVLGPKGRHYVIDHHHLARALHEEGVEKVFVVVTADLSKLDQEPFWVMLDNRSWMHPFDAKGRRCGYDRIPLSVADLEDDPFRSLAGELRRVGGFAKDTTPFSEFLWADFLRRRIKRSQVDRDFKRALSTALRLAKSGDADYLPGWCGVVEET
jgi:hypothetical protein